MAKTKGHIFFCSSCGCESSKWMGQCPACKEWNTFTEAPASGGLGGGKPRSDKERGGLPKQKPKKLSEIVFSDEEKLITGIEEFDRVLGGGIVPGSLVLLGGDPGIGKSTLLLQVCQRLAGSGKKVLYVSGEESLKQIKLRANRVGEFSGDFLLLSETNMEDIRESIAAEKADMVVIDSIQTIYSETVSAAPGSVSQVREATSLLLQTAKGLGISIFIVGHVTKEGTVAGPRLLEHMVDTVLYFEGDRHASYRILRGVKNRFGSTNEIGVFQMQEAGLSEVKNPSEYMLSGKPEHASGSIVSCSLEGSRPVLIEIQALVCQSYFNIPRRQATGSDFNRINLLMAVLEKRLGLQIAGFDAYINVAGGMRITEPAIDLAICMAIISSYKNRSIDDQTIAFGEVGLSGEVRSVSMAEIRVQEARKLGFTTCIVPFSSARQLQGIKGIRIVPVKSLRDLPQ